MCAVRCRQYVAGGDECTATVELAPVREQHYPRELVHFCLVTTDYPHLAPVLAAHCNKQNLLYHRNSLVQKYLDVTVLNIAQQSCYKRVYLSYMHYIV